MLGRFVNQFVDLKARQRIGLCLSKGHTGSAHRRVKVSDTVSWEFSGFSQNGEDGIIDVLISKLLTSDRVFLEIGAGSGLENNSSWLALTKGYAGIMVDGVLKNVSLIHRNICAFNLGVHGLQQFVDETNVAEILKAVPSKNPDFFSLDIDGVDFYIAQKILSPAFHPKIIAVEYNSAFGPSDAVTVQYDPNFYYRKKHISELYYGVSLAGWTKCLNEKGYRIVATDKHGVNAFFVDPKCFSSEFLSQLVDVPFRENVMQQYKFSGGFEVQSKIIKDLPTHAI